MTNVAAAIGLAQLENIEWHLQRRLEIADWYRDELGSIPNLTWQLQQPWAKHVYWMFTVVLPDRISASRDELIRRLLQRGVETRPVFYPVHILPPYSGMPDKNFPIAERIAERGLSLPSWGGLTQDDIRHVCATLVQCLETDQPD
jgi:perosamine synthetase